MRNIKTSQYGTDSIIITVLKSGGLGRGLWSRLIEMQVELDIL